MSRRKFTKQFKEAAVAKLTSGTPADKVARACRIELAVLRRWQRELAEFGARAFTGYGMSRHPRAQPRSQVIVVRLSPDEFDAATTASSATGCRSLSDFARSCMFHAAGEGPLARVEKKLDELSVALTTLTQLLPKR